MLTSRSTNGGTDLGQPDHHRHRVAGQELDRLRQHHDQPVLRQLLHPVRHHQRQPIRMKTSTNGGLTWGAALTPSERRDRPRRAAGGAAQRHRPRALPAPPTRPDPLVPLRRRRRQLAGHGAGLHVSHHTVAGGLREEPLPSAEIDSAGTAYVAWADCRFRTGCPATTSCVSEVDQRNHLGRALPGPDRRHLQHRGPLRARHRRRPIHLRRHRPASA